jgi:hypothetical protein
VQLLSLKNNVKFVNDINNEKAKELEDYKKFLEEIFCNVKAKKIRDFKKIDGALNSTKKKLSN